MIRCDIFKVDYFANEFSLSYVGYALLKEFDPNELWNICNWSEYSKEKPYNLYYDISSCSTDVVFLNSKTKEFYYPKSVGWITTSDPDALMNYIENTIWGNAIKTLKDDKRKEYLKQQEDIVKRYGIEIFNIYLNIEKGIIELLPYKHQIIDSNKDISDIIIKINDNLKSKCKESDPKFFAYYHSKTKLWYIPNENKEPSVAKNNAEIFDIIFDRLKKNL